METKKTITLETKGLDKVVKDLEAVNNAQEILNAYLQKIPSISEKALVDFAKMQAKMQEISSYVQKGTEKNIEAMKKYTEERLKEEERFTQKRQALNDQRIKDDVKDEGALNQSLMDLQTRQAKEAEKIGILNVKAFKNHIDEKMKVLGKYRSALAQEKIEAEREFQKTAGHLQKDSDEYIAAYQIKEKALEDFEKKDKIVRDKMQETSKSFLTVVSDQQKAVGAKITGVTSEVDKQLENAGKILKDGFGSITKIYDARIAKLQKEQSYKEAKSKEKLEELDKELENLEKSQTNKTEKQKEKAKLEAEKSTSEGSQSNYNTQIERYKKQYKIKDEEKTTEENGVPAPTLPEEEGEKEVKSLEELLSRKLELEKEYRDSLIELDEEGKEKKEEEKELNQEEALGRVTMLEELSKIEGQIAAKKGEEIEAANTEIFNSEQFVLDEKRRIEAEKKTIEEQAAADKAALDAKIKKEEEKKAKIERIQKKAEFVIGIAQAISNVAKGVTQALAYGPFIGPALAAMVAASGAIQVGIMTGQLKYMEDGGLLRGKRHSQGGMRIQGSNIEVEGGEYVVNRESTDKNLGLIRYINSQRKELNPDDINTYFGQPSSIPTFSSPFASEMERGGQVPMLDPNIDISNSELLASIQQIKIESRVSVTDINTVQDNMTKVDEWTGL